MIRKQQGDLWAVGERKQEQRLGDGRPEKYEAEKASSLMKATVFLSRGRT